MAYLLFLIGTVHKSYYGRSYDANIYCIFFKRTFIVAFRFSLVVILGNDNDSFTKRAIEALIVFVLYVTSSHFFIFDW